MAKGHTKLFLPLLIVQIFNTCSANFAEAGLVCEDAFSNKPSRFEQLKLLEGFDHHDRVLLIGATPGDHGGKRLVLQLPKYESIYDPIDAAKSLPPRGDPRWFVRVAGEKVGEFFGYEKIADSFENDPNYVLYSIPDRQEMNGAIKKFNTLAITAGRPQDQINLRFYDATEGISADADYVTRFLIELGGVRELPWAKFDLENRFSRGLQENIHDATFHSGFIFESEVNIKNFFGGRQAVQGFLVWLNKPENPFGAKTFFHTPSGQRILVKTDRSTNFEGWASAIDSFTGVTLGFFSRAKLEKSFWDRSASNENSQPISEQEQLTHMLKLKIWGLVGSTWQESVLNFVSRGKAINEKAFEVRLAAAKAFIAEVEQNNPNTYGNLRDMTPNQAVSLRESRLRAIREIIENAPSLR